MLSIEAARKIGINACIDKIGRDFLRKYKDSAVYAYGDGETENSVFCYVGVDDKPWVDVDPDVIVLDSTSQFPYRVSCNVCLDDGAMKFIECVLPAWHERDYSGTGCRNLVKHSEML